MKEKITLLIDAAVNLILGILLLIFSQPIISFLGVPGSHSNFYPNILGAVFIGIAIALLIECFRKEKGLIGLGLGGAITINLCGGAVLIFWLIFGKLNLPTHGQIFLWCLAAFLIIISTTEAIAFKRFNKN